MTHPSRETGVDSRGRGFGRQRRSRRPGPVGSRSASAATVSQTVTTDNIIATKTVSPAVAHPGETVTSTITFKTSSGLLSVDRYLENLTDFRPPATCSRA